MTAAESHGRLPWFEPENLSEAQRSVYDAIASGPRLSSVRSSPLVDEKGRLQGPFNAMLVDPPIGGAVQAVGSTLRYETELPNLRRELAILVVSVAHRCSFEWIAHEHLARTAGATDGQLDDLMDAKLPSGLESDDEVSCQVVSKLLLRGDLDDELFAKAEEALGAVQLAELIYLVGYYELLARSLRVWRTPLPKGCTDPFFGMSQNGPGVRAN